MFTTFITQLLTSGKVASSASNTMLSSGLKKYPGRGVLHKMDSTLGLQGHWATGEFWSQTGISEPPRLQLHGRQPDERS